MNPLFWRFDALKVKDSWHFKHIFSPGLLHLSFICKKKTTESNFDSTRINCKDVPVDRTFYRRRQVMSYLCQKCKKHWGHRRSFPIRKRSMPFSRHLKFFFNCELIFLYQIKEKGEFPSNHLVSNQRPLFPDIPLIPLYYQVDPPNLLKI